jgi:4,5:9,10-diseco-3-hydroxy-5,9,17-trioxoandrosta-1(10),2-diene-4-oate hydrolase
MIWGRDNRVQGYDNGSFMLNRIPDVQMRIYGRAGLWVPWERPQSSIER